MGDESNRRDAGAARGGRERRHQHAVIVQARVGHADRVQFGHEQVEQHQLPGSARCGQGRLVGTRVDSDVAEKSLERGCAHAIAIFSADSFLMTNNELPATKLPVIDVSLLVTGRGDRSVVASEIAQACRDSGFFYIVGHGVDEELQRRLENASRRFFAQDLEAKMEIAMSRGGRAWRGYFPVGAELTSGKADLKEGIYFGAELPPDHPRVKDGTPLHGANLFPQSVPELREVVLGYIDAMTRLGHALMEGIASSLGLEASYFADHGTRDPLTLFRIFNYPPPALPESSLGSR